MIIVNIIMRGRNPKSEERFQNTTTSSTYSAPHHSFIKNASTKSVRNGRPRPCLLEICKLSVPRPADGTGPTATLPVRATLKAAHRRVRAAFSALAELTAYMPIGGT